MIREEWTFESDMLFKNTPAPELGENMVRRQLMMTKEIFKECIMRWLVLKGEKADVGEEEDK